MKIPITESRAKCYHCYRPLSLCLCSTIKPIQTNTKFIILMHPKEFKKTKNGTGHFTHLSLLNSQLFVGDDFSSHNAINTILNDETNLCYILYPGETSINLNTQRIDPLDKQLVIFLIDGTWPCSSKMLRLSHNLRVLPRLSFTHTKISQFQIKEQPHDFCLSTIESTLITLELLNANTTETIETQHLEHFLTPFLRMVEHQISCISDKQHSRSKKFIPPRGKEFSKISV